MFVRWDNLEKGASTQGLLPGLGESTVRTFDAPEALGIRFHEVRGALGDQRGAEAIADAVPLDDQPVPRLHPCVRLIYCFARPTHTYLDLNAREDFEREIVVKVNVPELRPRRAARGRRGRAITSRSAPTPTPTSGSRAATG